MATFFAALAGGVLLKGPTEKRKRSAAAVMMSVWRRGVLPWNLAHSDQGDQNTNEQF